MYLKIIVVRHGQSVSNVCDVFHEDSGDELTMIGKMQAIEAGKKIRELFDKKEVLGLDAIYCSPYERAKSTCASALEAARLDVKKMCNVYYDDRLRERELTGLHGKKFDKEHWIKLQDFKSDLAEKEGIETFDALEERAGNFIDDLVRKYYPIGTVLVFTHGLFELAMYTNVYGRPASGNTYELDLLKNGGMRIYNLNTYPKM